MIKKKKMRNNLIFLLQKSNINKYKYHDIIYKRGVFMKKIMVVEDDKDVAKELFDLLNSSGYEVQVLEDFSNSKEIILNSKSDLMLLDINIPYLNGEMLLKEIRKESNIPVIW